MAKPYRYQGGYHYVIVAHDGTPVIDTERRITNPNTLLDKELGEVAAGTPVTLMGWTYVKLAAP